jgi:hypothetical protein
MIVEQTDDAKYASCIKCGDRIIKTKSNICLMCYTK